MTLTDEWTSSLNRSFSIDLRDNGPLIPGDFVCIALTRRGRSYDSFGIVVSTYEANPYGSRAVVLWTKELQLTPAQQGSYNAVQQIMAEEDANVFKALDAAAK